MAERTITEIFEGVETSDGAGVRLKRIINHKILEKTDPFLMLDFFGSENPDDYIAGFPWHPHRGIETVTYMLKGEVQHEDSLGNKGVIKGGDLQWMTAGSGIIHQEIPKVTNGLMKGFQLWVNLPSKQKMTAPGYQEYSAESIPIVEDEKMRVKVISGRFGNIEGPVIGNYIQPLFLDIEINKNSELTIPVETDHNLFTYIFEGEGFFGEEQKIQAGKLIIFSEGDFLKIKTGKSSIRLLLIAGKPLKEPVAWRGPIVMNTEEELDTAFRELQEDTFIK